MVPGEYVLQDGDVELNAGRTRTPLRVENAGDRPIQVGSHTHFFEVNAALRFDRDAARGRRLDIPAGTSLRFEPGEARDVTLIPLAGLRVARGMRGLVDGPLERTSAASEPRERSAPAKRRASERVGESEGQSPSGER
jgi:urease beta subunit